MPGDYSNKYAGRTIVGGPIKFVRPNSSGANQYFGRTSVVSAAGGAITATISTALVNSDSVITLGMHFTNQGTGQTPWTWGVTTISPGGFFRIANIGSVSLTGSHTPTVMWAILNPR